MGNCECVPVSNCNPFSGGEEGSAKTAVRIAKPRQSDDEQTSLISFSSLSRSNFQKSPYSSSFMIGGQPSKQGLQFSVSRGSQNSLKESKWSQIEQSCQVSIEVLEKLQIKQFYQLKRLIQNNNAIIEEGKIPGHYFQVERASLEQLTEKPFKKIKILNLETNQAQTCYYHGEIQMHDSKQVLQGKGELFYLNGAYYNGHFHFNCFHKSGIYIHPDKDYYYGSWKFNKAQGFGQFSHFEGVLCRGEWLNDLQHGVGEEYWPDGAIFRGYFQNGTKKNGRFSWPNKSYYEGQFRNNKFQGKGVFYWQDGRVYEGDWENNMMHGVGIFQWPNGQVYKGNYECDKKHGKGLLTLCDGTAIKGRWIDGKLQGLSQVTRQGITRQMRWKDGVQVNL